MKTRIYFTICTLAVSLTLAYGQVPTTDKGAVTDSTDWSGIARHPISFSRQDLFDCDNRTPKDARVQKTLQELADFMKTHPEMVIEMSTAYDSLYVSCNKQMLIAFYDTLVQLGVDRKKLRITRGAEDHDNPRHDLIYFRLLWKE